MLHRLRSYISGSALLKISIGSLGLKVCAAVGGLLLGIVLARLLGPAEFGIYTIVLAAINLAMTTATLGLPPFVVREVAKFGALEQWGLLKGVIYTSHLWVGVALAVLLLVVLAVEFVEIVHFETQRHVVFLAALIIPFYVFSQIRASVLRGLHLVILADLPELLIRPLVMLLLVIVCYTWLGHASASQALAMQLGAAVVTFLTGTWLLKIRIPAFVKSAELSADARGWSKDTLPFFWISMFSLLEGQVGMYLLATYSEVSQVGLFQAALQLVSLIIIGLVAVNAPLQPKLAATWARGDVSGVQSLITESARLGMVLAFVGAVVLIPFAELVVQLYGNEYLEAANVLRILVVGQVVNAAAGSCGLLLSATGYQKYVLRGIVIALLVNLSLGLLLIPKYEAIGAAISTVIGLLTWNVVLASIAWKKMKINTTVLGRF